MPIWKGWIEMLRLPGNTPLPEAVSALLSKPDCRKAICLPQADGKLFVMDCAFLTSQNGVTLLAGLEQERTEAGSGFIRGLWFDQPAEIWLQSGGRNPQTCRPCVPVPYRGTVVPACAASGARSGSGGRSCRRLGTDCGQLRPNGGAHACAAGAARQRMPGDSF